MNTSDTETVTKPSIRSPWVAVLCVLLGFSVGACAAPQHAGPQTGSNPALPAPQKPRLLPTINIAPAKGWPQGETPRAAPGLRVDLFADRLEHPRWLYVLPNGDVLVAETNAPPKPAADADAAAATRPAARIR